MATRQLRRPGTSAPSDGSRTITVQDNQPREESSQSEAESSTVGTLRLRGAPRNRQRVVWREDVVDNEGAGKKKSKNPGAVVITITTMTTANMQTAPVAEWPQGILRVALLSIR
ncbi:hypothetical protein ACG7TL_006757 [Trametes sanguinea]